MSDTLSDFLTRIRNAGRAKHRYADVLANSLIRQIAGILEQEGFIDRFEERQEGPQALLRIFLRYDEHQHPLIQRARSISTPGRRHYAKASQIRPVLGGLGIAILTTSRGVMSGRQARRHNVGGELLCHICS